jgi:hypothetical protein
LYNRWRLLAPHLEINGQWKKFDIGNAIGDRRKAMQFKMVQGHLQEQRREIEPLVRHDAKSQIGSIRSY